MDMGRRGQIYVVVGGLEFSDNAGSELCRRWELMLAWKERKKVMEDVGGSNPRKGVEVNDSALDTSPWLSLVDERGGIC